LSDRIQALPSVLLRCRYNALVSTLAGEVAVSVIIPAYRAASTLRACVESVLAQESDEPFEVVVVLSDEEEGDLSYAEDLPEDPRLHVIRHSPRLQMSPARRLGIAHARGERLAFVDADATAEPGWLAALGVSAFRQMCVAGSIINGTPRSAAGTTQYLLEFLDLHPLRPPASIRHGAGCNLGMPKSVWDRHEAGQMVSDDIDDVDSADTVLTTRARSDEGLAFVPAARVVHYNQTRFNDMMHHQFRLGRSAAYAARSIPVPLPRLMQTRFGAPAVVVARWISLWRRILVWPVGLTLRAIVLSAYLWLGLCAWGAGLFSGNRSIRLTRRG
jgi:glycosyltransferase involved in cell wall biosynthesis